MRTFISRRPLGDAYTDADLEEPPRVCELATDRWKEKEAREESGLGLAAHPRSAVSELVRVGL